MESGIRRHLSRSIAAFAGLVYAAQSLAVPVDSISGGVTGHDMPTYFSGTNCRVYMTVGNTYDGLKRVEFKVGGFLVWSENYSNPMEPPYIGTLSAHKAVMFDSTHFTHGTPIAVSVEVWGWGGSHRQFSDQATVKNAALLYGRMEFEQGSNPMERGVPSGVETLGPIYNLFVATTTPWTWQEMRTDLMHCNVFYVNTHSNTSVPWGFWTDRDEDSPPVQEVVFPWHSNHATLNVEDALYEKIGQGTPPFNSNHPPFNLVWLDACNTGQDNELAEAFLWPYVNAYGGWTENQCELGYRIQSSTICASATTSAFWEALIDGESAYKARIALHDAYMSVDPTCPATPQELIALWGDFATRLHFVYLEDFNVKSTAFSKLL